MIWQYKSKCEPIFSTCITLYWKCHDIGEIDNLQTCKYWNVMFFKITVYFLLNYNDLVNMGVFWPHCTNLHVCYFCYISILYILLYIVKQFLISCAKTTDSAANKKPQQDKEIRIDLKNNNKTKTSTKRKPKQTMKMNKS